MIWGFVGGRDYDAKALAGLLESVPPSDVVVVGSGMGSEKFVREQAPALGLSLIVPDLRPDLYDWNPDALIEVGEPPSADTRLLMLIRLDQVIAYGGARRAQREKVKIKGALEAQVAEVVAACLGGKLVLLGGARAKTAQAIVSRCEEVGQYGPERTKVPLQQKWEVIEL